jgi:membrane-bound inhibitor of C-type lysozyme
MQYGSQQSITEDNLYQILNQWVRDSGSKLYPESSFLLWEKGETLPAILVSP